MATLTTTKRRLPSPHPARDRTRIPRLEPATMTQAGRERTLAEARAREARARLNLGLALARAEQTYAQAVRSLEKFDEYLRAVRARLDHAGYLSYAQEPQETHNSPVRGPYPDTPSSRARAVAIAPLTRA
jgi:hypothetical protein